MFELQFLNLLYYILLFVRNVVFDRLFVLLHDGVNAACSSFQTGTSYHSISYLCNTTVLQYSYKKQK